MEKICRNVEQKRLNEVFEHVRKYYGIHTQEDFAKYIEYGRTSISAALNGKPEYLTERLFKAIVDKFPGVFNLDYLLNGEGQLLTVEETIARADVGGRVPPAAKAASQLAQVEIPEALQLLIDKTLAVSRHNDELVDRLAHAVSDNKEVQIALRTMSDTMHKDATEGVRLRCELATAIESVNSFRVQVDTIRQENESLRQSNQHLGQRLDKAAALFAELNNKVAHLLQTQEHRYPGATDTTHQVNEEPNVSPLK
jgi:regulator of replication initiation timing